MLRKKPVSSERKKSYLLVFHGTPSKAAEKEARLLVKQSKRVLHSTAVEYGVVDPSDKRYFKRVLLIGDLIDRKSGGVSDITVFPLVLLPGKHYQEVLTTLQETIPYREGRLSIHEPLCSLGAGMLLGTSETLSRRKKHAPRSPKSKSSGTDRVFSEFSAAYARLKRDKRFGGLDTSATNLARAHGGSSGCGTRTTKSADSRTSPKLHATG